MRTVRPLVLRSVPRRVLVGGSPAEPSAHTRANPDNTHDNQSTLNYIRAPTAPNRPHYLQTHDQSSRHSQLIVRGDRRRYTPSRQRHRDGVDSAVSPKFFLAFCMTPMRNHLSSILYSSLEIFPTRIDAVSRYIRPPRLPQVRGTTAA